MRKNVFGRQFKRDKNERKALFKGLLSELVLHGRIKTTEAKAKAIKADADKLVSKARKEVMLAKKLLSSVLIPEAIEKMVADVAPRFSKRNGGYTRIIKLGRRFNDDAQMVLLEWVESATIAPIGKKAELAKKSEKTEVVESEMALKKKVTKKKTTKTEEKPAKKPAIKKAK